MACISQQRWREPRLERLLWSSCSVALIGLLLVSLLSLVEGLDRLGGSAVRESRAQPIAWEGSADACREPLDRSVLAGQP